MKIISKLLIVVGILAILAWLAYREYGRYQISKMFEGDDPFELSKRVLVDSLNINDKVTIYQFTFDSGTFGHTEDFVSVGVNSNSLNRENSFLSSGSISSISKLGKDSLLIKLIEKKFTFDSTKQYIPFKIELESEGVYVRPSKRLDIHIK